MATSDERMRILVEKLQQDPGLAEGLPSLEGGMVRDALSGQTVYEIAQNYRVSERAVWDVLSAAARAASGTSAPQQVETGGFGSDTDPGVTGGYGETGFGSLGNESGVAIPEEPPIEGQLPPEDE